MYRFVIIRKHARYKKDNVDTMICSVIMTASIYPLFVNNISYIVKNH